MPIHAVALMKECQHLPTLTDIHLYIVQNQLSLSSVLPKERVRVKVDTLNYVVSNELLLHINAQEK